MAARRARFIPRSFLLRLRAFLLGVEGSLDVESGELATGAGGSTERLTEVNEFVLESSLVPVVTGNC